MSAVSYSEHGCLSEQATYWQTWLRREAILNSWTV